jgi:hypothetical protein
VLNFRVVSRLEPFGGAIEIRPASIAFQGIAQTLPTRSFAKSGMRRSGQLHHPELRCEPLGPKMRNGIIPNAK